MGFIQLVWVLSKGVVSVGEESSVLGSQQVDRRVSRWIVESAAG